MYLSINPLSISLSLYFFLHLFRSRKLLPFSMIIIILIITFIFIFYFEYFLKFILCYLGIFLQRKRLTETKLEGVSLFWTQKLINHIFLQYVVANVGMDKMKAAVAKLPAASKLLVAPVLEKTKSLRENSPGLISVSIANDIYCLSIYLSIYLTMLHFYFFIYISISTAF